MCAAVKLSNSFVMERLTSSTDARKSRKRVAKVAGLQVDNTAKRSKVSRRANSLSAPDGGPPGASGSKPGKSE